MSLPRKYARFIANLNRIVDPAGNCWLATVMMIESFPELRQERGFVVDASGERHTHWCVRTRDGLIVDPTAAQFALTPLTYEVWDHAKHGSLEEIDAASERAELLEAFMAKPLC